MNLTVTGKQIDISKPFRDHVNDKLQALNKKYSIDPLEIMVTVSHESHDFHCEISAHIGRGVHMRCKNNGSDGYTCFDNTIEVLEQRLRRHKKRLTDHNRKRDVHVKNEMIPSYVLTMDEDHPSNPGKPTEENDDHLAPPIIAESKKELPTISVSEAVFRMDMVNENPFIFRNSSHGRVNVVYKREDGNIGWVDIPHD